jgi:hypothetical protein
MVEQQQLQMQKYSEIIMVLEISTYRPLIMMDGRTINNVLVNEVSVHHWVNLGAFLFVKMSARMQSII